MTRTRSPWLLSLPLALTGSVLAHSLAYGLVAPDAHTRSELLRSSGHAYLELASLAAAAVCALLLVAVLRHAALAARGVRSTSPSPRLFALLPPLVFAVQEHLERLLASGEIPFTAAVEPTFLVGLLLQLPFALLGFSVARALVRASEWLGTPERRVAVSPGALPATLYATVALPPPLAFASGRSQRGPPHHRRPRS